MIEKDKTQKNRQAKDKRSSKEALGALQANYTKKIRKYLLYLFSSRTARSKLAHWTLMAKGKPGSVLEIRFTGSETPMLSLQHKPWGKGSGLLLKNAKGNRSRSNAKTPRRQKSNSKGIRPLSETHRGIPKPLKRPTHTQGILAKR